MYLTKVTNASPYPIIQIPARFELIQLDSAWRYQPGDNPIYRQPTFNDRQWPLLNPAQDIQNLPQLIGRVGWFRLRLRLDSAAVGQPMALMIQQVVASEVYVNGRLLKRIGQVYGQGAREKTHVLFGSNFIPIQFDRPGENVLAVRYSFSGQNYYFHVEGHTNYAFFATLVPLPLAIHDRERQLSVDLLPDALQVGIYFILALLHLFLYVSLPIQKANLYFGLASVCSLVYYFLQLVINQLVSSLSIYYHGYLVVFVFSVLAFTYGLLAAYQLYGLRVSRVLYLLIGFALLSLVGLRLYPYGPFIILFYSSLLLFIAETIRCIVAAIGLGRQGARFHLACFALLFVLLGAQLAINLYEPNVLIERLLLTSATICPSIGFSALLAAEYAQIGRELQVKLRQVETLSSAAIAQEQEKHRILASQNEILEQQVKERTFELIQDKNRIEQQARQLQLIMKELHHRVKNNLSIVAGLLELQSTNSGDQFAKQALLDGHERVQAMSLIHQRLYQTDDVLTINMRLYVNELVSMLSSIYNCPLKKANRRIQIDLEELDVDIAIPLGMILNELITNAFKYALCQVQRPALTIRLLSQEGLLLEVMDNGPGIELASWQRPEGSFGKRLILGLLNQLNGSITVNNEQGTQFRLTFPFPAS